jgi:hypothetical protein
MENEEGDMFEGGQTFRKGKGEVGSGCRLCMQGGRILSFIAVSELC